MNVKWTQQIVDMDDCLTDALREAKNYHAGVLADYKSFLDGRHNDSDSEYYTREAAAIVDAITAARDALRLTAEFGAADIRAARQ